MSTRKRTCGRCGVYRHLHPTKSGCKRPTLSPWWQRHSLTAHFKGWVWVYLFTEKARWRYVWRVMRPGLCWCELVDCVIRSNRNWRSDYKGPWSCLCDVPLPSNVGAPDPRGCYCSPPAEHTNTPEERTREESA